jgi:hypothetical protein
MDLLKEGRLSDAEEGGYPYFRQICLTSPDLLEAHARELANEQERQMKEVLQTREVSTEEATETWTLRDLGVSNIGVVEEPSQVTVNGEYSIWYGTNRRPIDSTDHTKGYSAEREEPGTVHYGSCKVFIPRSHKIGSIGGCMVEATV